MVFDECHHILQSRGFRLHFCAANKFAKYTFKKIYLTATLSPAHQDAFYNFTELVPALTRVIRTDTVNLLIQYNVHYVKTQFLKSATLHMARRLQTSFKPDSRGIIFCQTKTDAAGLAKQIGCGTAFDSTLKEGTKKQLFNDWTKGQSIWIVATSSFLQGIDYPYVDAVIFYKTPHGLVDFVQGSGRGARAGRQSTTVIVTDKTPPNVKHDEYALKYGMQSEMLDMVKSTICYRKLISQNMDIIPVTCHDIPEAVACGHCSPNSVMSQLVRGLIQEHPDAQHSSISSEPPGVF